MFEGTLVESRGVVASGTQRWTAVGSVAIQCAVAGLLLAIPLLRPEVLQMAAVAPPLAVPFLHRAPVVVQQTAASAASTAVSLPAAGAAVAPMGRTIWPRPGDGDAAPGPMVQTMVGMGPVGSALSNVLSVGGGNRAVAVVRAKEVGPVRVSTGVSDGLLLAPIRPVYPAIAKAAGVQGAVVVEAVISKAGRIESLHAVSGPVMLTRAAMDAVAGARYRPYLLNGEAAEVRTTTTVVFTLGG
jgi:protein TonB